MKSSGEVTPSEFAGIFRDLVAHPQWKRGMNILSDYVEADGRKLTAEEVRAMSQGYAAMANELGPGRSALIVSESLQYGLTRMWISWTEMKVEREVRVFTSMDEARAWLTGESGPDAKP
jgi:hypothetical protein